MSTEHRRATEQRACDNTRTLLAWKEGGWSRAAARPRAARDSHRCVPGLATAGFRIPPPSKWEDSETLCADLWRRIWQDENTQRNGRSGQPQNGVDVFGRPGKGSRWAGIQCKGKNEFVRSVLTERELL